MWHMCWFYQMNILVNVAIVMSYRLEDVLIFSYVRVDSDFELCRWYSA